MKLAGNNCNAFDAWLINLGLKTLTVRMDRQCKTALHLATEFGKIDRIQNINYPGLPSDSNFDIASKQMDAFGAMISFEVGKSAAEAIQFANKLKLCAIAPSLGETDSMILHPASMSHLKVPLELRLKYRITDSLIRLSVGLEHPEDILEDIFQALK
jgi:methionine-gamma-lyase